MAALATPEPHYRIGVDIGGTFTDFVLLDTRSGQIYNEKVLTTPADPSQAVLQGIGLLMAAHKVLPHQVAQVIHGTTLVANALIERKGVRTALVTTRGFADVLELGLEWRYDTYDLKLQLPPPLAPRELRFEVAERIGPDGRIIRALDEASVLALVAPLRAAKVRAVAVCLLHSFRNPLHEDRVKRLLANALPDIVICTSSDVVPEIGAGGGSIARIDRLGLLQVGPDSASAEPGPACYGRGGTYATVTDADLVLGYLGADSFLGGDMRLDVAAARAAIERYIATPLALSIEDAATVRTEVIAAMHYIGQGFEVDVTLDPEFLRAEDRLAIASSFANAYRVLFGRTESAMAIEIVSWRVMVSGPRPVIALSSVRGALHRSDGRPRASGMRSAWFAESGGYLDTPVYQRHTFSPDQTLSGPALIEERESTLVVPPGARVHCDASANLLLDLGLANTH